MASSVSSTGCAWKPRRSSAATPSLNCATRKRRWRWRGNSCNCTSTTCRAGRGRASFARLLPLEARLRQTQSAAMTAADIHRTILAVWRIEQPRLIPSLSRMLRDVPLADDLTLEALVAALEHWPTSSVPEQPGAWLMATSQRRALGQLRRTKLLAREHELVARHIAQKQLA